MVGNESSGLWGGPCHRSWLAEGCFAQHKVASGLQHECGLPPGVAGAVSIAGVQQMSGLLARDALCAGKARSHFCWSEIRQGQEVLLALFPWRIVPNLPPDLSGS